MCPGCGHPRDHAWDDRSEGEYETVRHTCQACSVRETETRDQKPKAGEQVTVRRLPPQHPAAPPDN